jgi:hypothetical protein
MGNVSELAASNERETLGNASKVAPNVAPVAPRLKPGAIQTEQQALGASSSITQTVKPSLPQESKPLQVPDTVSQDMLKYLRTDSTFIQLSRSQQQKFLEVLDVSLRYAEGSARSKIESEFKELLTAQTKEGPALLSRDRSEQGATLLDHLHTLATYNADLLPSSLRQHRHELLRSMVQETGNALENINQGKYATCVPTVANRHLAANQPAEYARIITELATTGRTVMTRTDPATGKCQAVPEFTLEYVAWSASADALKGRSISESMFQTSFGNMVGTYKDGMYTDQAEIVYEAAFGASFRRIDSSADAFAKLENASQRGESNMVSLKWSASGAHSNHALEVLRVFSERDIQTRDGKSFLIIEDSGREIKIPVDAELRAALREGKVVINRNPWGKEYPNPEGIGAHTIDQKLGLLWMSERDFRSRINYALVQGGNFGVTPGGDRPVFTEPTIFLVDPAIESPSLEAAPMSGSFESKFSSSRRQEAISGPTGAPPKQTDEHEQLEKVSARIQKHGVQLGAAPLRAFSPEMTGWNRASAYSPQGTGVPSFNEGMAEIAAIHKSGPDFANNPLAKEIAFFRSTANMPIKQLAFNVKSIIESGLPDEDIARDLGRLLSAQSHRLDSLQAELEKSGFDLRANLKRIYKDNPPRGFEDFLTDKSSVYGNSFNAESAARSVKYYIDSGSLRTFEEGRVVDILLPLNRAERKQVADAYKALTAKDLDKAITDRFSEKDSRFMNSLLKGEGNDVAEGLAWSISTLHDWGNKDEAKKWVIRFLEVHAAQSQGKTEDGSVLDSAYSTAAGGSTTVERELTRLHTEGSQKLDKRELELCLSLLNGTLSEGQKEIVSRRKGDLTLPISEYRHEDLFYKDMAVATAHRLREATSLDEIQAAMRHLSPGEAQRVHRAYREEFKTSFMEKMPYRNSPVDRGSYQEAHERLVMSLLAGGADTNLDTYISEWRMRATSRNITPADLAAWNKLTPAEKSKFSERYTMLFKSNFEEDLSAEKYSESGRMKDEQASYDAAVAAQERWERENAYTVGGSTSSKPGLPSRPKAAPPPTPFFPAVGSPQA